MMWLDNPEADYVLAAYAIAVLALFGLLLVSWRGARKRAAEWRRIQNTRAKEI